MASAKKIHLRITQADSTRQETASWYGRGLTAPAPQTRNHCRNSGGEQQEDARLWHFRRGPIDDGPFATATPETLQLEADVEVANSEARQQRSDAIGCGVLEEVTQLDPFARMHSVWALLVSAQ